MRVHTSKGLTNTHSQEHISCLVPSPLFPGTPCLHIHPTQESLSLLYHGEWGGGGCNTPQYLVKMRSRATPCTSLMCIFRLYLRAVRWEQNWQENGFSPVWVMTCRCNSVGEPQITGQRWHLGTSVPPSQPSSIPSTYNRQNKLSQFLGQLGAAVGHQQRHPQQYTFPQE